MEIIFWCSASAVLFSYVGYPLFVYVLARLIPHESDQRSTQEGLPYISVVLPVHNEECVIEKKIENTQTLNYPRSLLQFLVVSDGCTDKTASLVRAAATHDETIQLIALSERSGKETALNIALNHASGEIVVFTDASIMLEPECLIHLARAFSDPNIGCVSGEDRVEGGAAEGLYGRYELYIRRQESVIYSLVGASGCIYAQRKNLCRPFVPGLAPDLFSVLQTVAQDHRSVSEPRARGVMKATKSSGAEFQRKIRTVLRGISTLNHHRQLLNPLRYGRFSVLLICHKLLRWLVPFFLLSMLISSALLTDDLIYRTLFVGQLAGYGLGIAAWSGFEPIAGSRPGRLAGYLTMSNVAVLFAWARWLSGSRQLIWAPTNR